MRCKNVQKSVSKWSLRPIYLVKCPKNLVNNFFPDFFGIKVVSVFHFGQKFLLVYSKSAYFLICHAGHSWARKLSFWQNDILMRASFWQNFSLLTPLCQKLKKRTLDGAKGTRVYIYIFIKISSREVIFNELMVSFFCSFFFYQYILATAVI